MAPLSTSPNLSQADEQILAQVFDPESSPDTPKVKIDPSLPADAHITDPTVLQSLKKRELEAIQLIESYSGTATPLPAAIRPSPRTPQDAAHAKDQAHDAALALLGSLIAEYPAYASAYNNRAQVRRWRHGDPGPQRQGAAATGWSAAAAEALALALQDLDTAIGLASPGGGGVGDAAAVSPTRAKLLAQAWTQKGAVFWGLGRRAAVAESNGGEWEGARPEPEWWKWDRMRLEEEGSRCFFMAGLFGSEMGRTMAVKANPYARLCGGIVREAMRREGTVS